MLTNEVALITGGARGIGAGIARVVAALGARVALLDLDGAEAEKTASDRPLPGLALACDVAIEPVVVAAVGAVVQRLGDLTSSSTRRRGAGPAGHDYHPPRHRWLAGGRMSTASWDEYLPRISRRPS